MTARLYTFTISHFAEKARWALDYKGIHYQEKRLVPGSHFPIVKRIVRIPEKATTLSGAWRPRDPVDDDQGGARA
jgi:glutathione S-transferase